MSLVVCPECNKDVSDQAEICPHCGYPLQGWEDEEEIKCPECGTLINIEDEVCFNCGYPLKESYDYQESKTIINNINYVENKESAVSIISLICYILGFITNIIKPYAGSLFAVLALVLSIIGVLEKGRKNICANIVFWINIVGTGIIILIIGICVLASA